MRRTLPIGDDAVDVYIQDSGKGWKVTKVAFRRGRQVVAVYEREGDEIREISAIEKIDEKTIGAVLAKAERMAAALRQSGNTAYVAVDPDGRIIGTGKTPLAALSAADWQGWGGWFGTEKADDTAAIVPVDA